MTSVLDAVLAVLTAIAEWFVTTVGSMTSIFYVAGTGLTFIGTLAVIGVGIAVILLVIMMIRQFLSFR